MDLSTTYLGLALKSPLVPSASPLGREIASIRQLEDAGAAAIVLPSLFEEQVTRSQVDLDHFMSRDADSFSEASSFFPELSTYNLGPDSYLEHVAKAKAAVNVPIIASLNGVTDSGWLEYARLLEKAGADAIELNVYLVAADAFESGVAVERRYLDILSHVKSSVSIPVSMKLGPYFSSFAHFARELDLAGVDGLVLFNRFYQPDIDLEAREVVPNVQLSTSSSTRLPMRWIAILYSRIEADLAASSGIHTGRDALKLLMAGASVTMVASALLKNGPAHLRLIEAQMRQWMEENEYESVQQLRGALSQKSCPDPSAFERTNYMKGLMGYASR